MTVIPAESYLPAVPALPRSVPTLRRGGVTPHPAQSGPRAELRIGALLRQRPVPLQNPSHAV